MTGTAATEANEFLDIYRLDVLEIPTNRPVDRTDEHDEVYRTVKEKIARHRRRDRRLPPPRPADSGRHRVDREVGDAVGAAEGPQVHPRARPIPQEAGRRPQARQGGRAQGAAQRGRRTTSSTSPARTAAIRSPTRCSMRATTSRRRYHRPGRRAGHGDDRHQHGRPRHRHPARRQRPLPRPRLAQGGDRRGPHGRRARWRRRLEACASGSTISSTPATSGSTSRLKEWVDAKLADWTKQQSGSGESRRPRRSPRSARHRGRAPPVAEKRAEIAQEYAKVQAGAGTTATMPTAFDGWTDGPCARRRASGSGAPIASGASARLTRPCSAS